tara:strand:- start:2496 stop:4310 length:1815 start_codon:yes stop_codon:yes gene_type:complete
MKDLLQPVSSVTALGAFLITSTLGWAAGAPDLSEVMEENTTFLVMVPDLSSLSVDFDESAFGELWRDEEIKKVIGSIAGGSGLHQRSLFSDEEMEEQWEQYGHLFDGGFGYGITSPDVEWESVDWANFTGKDRYLFVADFSGSMEELDGFLSPWSDVLPENILPGQKAYAFEEEFMGHRLWIEEVTTDEGELIRRNGWTLVNGKALLGEPIEYLRDAVARIADPQEGGSLVEAPGFLDARDRIGDSDIFVYIDLETFGEILSSGLADGVEKGLKGTPNQMGVTPEGVVNALGLEGLRTFHLAMNFGAERSEIRGGITYAEKKGLLNLLAYGEGPLMRPSIVPDHPVSAGVGRMRWMDIWQEVKNMAAEISPSFGLMVEMMRNNFIQSTGVDFERSLIGALGEETVTYSTQRKSASPDEDEPVMVDSVMAFQLQDPSGFVLALEGLKGMFGVESLFEEKDVEGTIVSTAKYPLPDDPGAFLSYAVAGDYFLFGTGSDGLLESAIARKNGKDGGFWNRPEVEDLLAELPEGAVGAGYADLGFLLNDLIEAYIAFTAQVAGEGGVPVELEDRPDSWTFPYFMISGQYSEENGFFYESLVFPKERLEP